MPEPLRSSGAATEPNGTVEPDAEPGHSQAREDDLQLGLGQLSRLVMGSLSVDQLMRHVANSAVLAIPGAEGAGAILLSTGLPDERIEALAASHEFVREIDAIQYELLDEGPCITAAREGRTVVSHALDDEPRWPRFAARVRRLGVRSVLSLPMLLPDDAVVGALNIYARQAHAFDDDAARLGALFAAPAAVAVHNSHVLSQAQTQAEQLRAALVNRAIIDQAIGILRSRSGGNAEQGFAALRERSQRDNIKLAVVAERVVDEAVRRARARRSED